MNIDDDFNKQQYEEHLQDYLDLNQDSHVGGGTAQARASFVKQFLTPDSHIFEIGSGGGADAKALQAEGYTVTASDYTEKFVEVLKANDLSAVLFNAKTDSLPENVDAVYANAVFVHFTQEELVTFLQRASSTLKNAKIVFFSVIKGEGAERRAPSSGGTGLTRDFQYYTEDNLKKILEENSYELLGIRLLDDKWIQIVAQLH